MSRLRSIWRRWPTALAVVCAAVFVDGDGAAAGLGEMLLFLPLVYLFAATIRRRRASWPFLVSGATTMVVLQALDVVSPAAILAVAALILLVYNAVTARLHRSDPVRLQALAMLGFGAIALVGLAVDPDLGRYLVAAGWTLHGVWDFVHLRRDAVVSRSYAEWCGVVDVLVGIGLVLL